MTNSKTNVKEHVPVQKIVLTQSYDAKILPAASYLDAGRRIKDSGRLVDMYIIIHTVILQNFGVVLFSVISVVSGFTEIKTTPN